MAFQKPEPGQLVTVEIAGRLFQLEYKLGALKGIERATGLSLFKPGTDQQFYSVSVLGPVLLVGLQAVKTNPPVTGEWLDENVSFGDLLDLVPAVLYAIYNKDPEAQNPPTPEAAPATAAIN